MVKKSTNGKLGKVAQIIRELLNDLQRAIKEVDTWDGSATNYASTDSYCAACLINVNGAAGREEQVQSHCMLPVREDGDEAGVYVDRALFAAAGGRGITQVVKPEDVPQDAWDAALRAAAVEIIDGYEQMDRVAPQSVYEIAGLPYPEEQRAISYQRIYEQVNDKIMEMGEAMEELVWLVDILQDRGVQYAIVAMGGHLYRADLVIEDDDVMLGEFTRVSESYIPVPRSTEVKTRAFRQANGRVRVVQIAATAVLNRVAEIDSTRLFDSFVTYAYEHDYFGTVNFHHFRDIRLGEIDFVARDGYCYIVSYVFDDTPIGRAAGEGFLSDPSYWGSSIEYYPTSEPEKLRMGDVDIPVYTSGINTGLAILAEDKAASLFTNAHQTYIERSKSMDQKIKDDLRKLVGDEQAEYAANDVDETNRAINDGGLIARSSDTDDVQEVVAQVEEVEEEEEVEQPTGNDQSGQAEFVLDETAVREIAQAVTETDQFAASLQAVNALQTRIDELSAQIAQLASANQRQAAKFDTFAQRLEGLEVTDAQKRANWVADLPSQPSQPTRIIARPRSQAPQVQEASNRMSKAADIAANTLSKLPTG